MGKGIYNTVMASDSGTSPMAGDTVTVRPVTFGSGCESPGGRLRTGKVVYVHPKGRFFTAEFEVGTGRKIRESFTSGSVRVTKERPRNGGPGVPRFRTVPGDEAEDL